MIAIAQQLWSEVKLLELLTGSLISRTLQYCVTWVNADLETQCIYIASRI